MAGVRVSAVDIIGAAFAVLFGGGMLAVLGFGAWSAYRTTQPPPDVERAREVEAEGVKKADAVREEQARQPLAAWINGRFGRRP